MALLGDLEEVMITPKAIKRGRRVVNIKSSDKRFWRRQVRSSARRNVAHEALDPDGDDYRREREVFDDWVMW